MIDNLGKLAAERELKVLSFIKDMNDNRQKVKFADICQLFYDDNYVTVAATALADLLAIKFIEPEKHHLYINRKMFSYKITWRGIRAVRDYQIAHGGLRNAKVQRQPIEKKEAKAC